MSQPQDFISSNYANNRQTFIIPLTFPNINDARAIIERISYGGDIWEVRVDLLSETGVVGDTTNIPSPAYVESQIRILRSMSPLPILFTIRTKSQGGKFPDDAADQALELMGIAVDCGVAYIDVEIEWPASTIGKIVTKAKAANTKIVASYHSWTGTVSWAGDEIQRRFLAADAFGDIIKLSILSPSLESTYELGIYARAHNQSQPDPKPLLAVGMGPHGQLSRITSPISLVTHPLIPFPSAPGQLSLAQVHQARYLMGLLPRREVRVYGKNGEKVKAVKGALEVAFGELGYPHVCTVGDTKGNLHGKDVLVIEDGSETLVDVVKGYFEGLTGRRAPISVITKSLEKV